ncbi:MAG: hypothetical protein IJL02_05200 [Methanobrevibacter sp.]|uniref:hypothetical protein n=1 Tax=Methanobrevibacter sp. TaxID=66852 RepID=UPI0025F5369A|nr:hypothetical protein [Methanobrevibacter sp.]MBQ6099244.1 hypothetical protein [Methanobrevibacter sp.]
MSSYIKLIIFVVVLVLVSTAIIFVDSSTDSMNKSMHDISDGIVDGDREYNEAVELVNNKYFYDGMDKAVSAGNNYNKSLLMLKDIQNNYSSDVNSVHQEYINTVINEVELKLQAVDLLKQAIECFEVNSNYTGTNYASEANDIIYQAKEYQNQRDGIVSNNSNLFKEI